MTCRVRHVHACASFLAAVVGLAGPFLLTGQAATASAAPLGLSTMSGFQWPAGTTGLIDVQQPLIFYRPAANTTWSETTILENGSGEVATSNVSLAAEKIESGGMLRALLAWRVTGSGTSSASLTRGDTCETHSSYSRCFTTVNVPAGGSEIIRIGLDRSLHSANGNYWWDASLHSGGKQTNVGLIQIPGGSTTVDGVTKVLDQTVYTGPPASSAAQIPQSTVAWFSPWEGEEGVGGEIYAAYGESSTAAGSWGATFTALNLGGEVTAVIVKAPTE